MKKYIIKWHNGTFTAHATIDNKIIAQYNAVYSKQLWGRVEHTPSDIIYLNGDILKNHKWGVSPITEGSPYKEELDEFIRDYAGFKFSEYSSF